MWGALATEGQGQDRRWPAPWTPLLRLPLPWLCLWDLHTTAAALTTKVAVFFSTAASLGAPVGVLCGGAVTSVRRPGGCL